MNYDPKGNLLLVSLKSLYDYIDDKFSFICHIVESFGDQHLKLL